VEKFDLYYLVLCLTLGGLGIEFLDWCLETQLKVGCIDALLLVYIEEIDRMLDSAMAASWLSLSFGINLIHVK
jgi:hypothetical protein